MARVSNKTSKCNLLVVQVRGRYLTPNSFLEAASPWRLSAAFRAERGRCRLSFVLACLIPGPHRPIVCSTFLVLSFPPFHRLGCVGGVLGLSSAVVHTLKGILILRMGSMKDYKVLV